MLFAPFANKQATITTVTKQKVMLNVYCFILLSFALCMNLLQSASTAEIDRLPEILL